MSSNPLTLTHNVDVRQVTDAALGQLSISLSNAEQMNRLPSVQSLGTQRSMNNLVTSDEDEERHQSEQNQRLIPGQIGDSEVVGSKSALKLKGGNETKNLKLILSKGSNFDQYMRSESPSSPYHHKNSLIETSEIESQKIYCQPDENPLMQQEIHDMQQSLPHLNHVIDIKSK